MPDQKKKNRSAAIRIIVIALTAAALILGGRLFLYAEQEAYTPQETALLEWTGSPAVEVNNNRPSFDEAQLSTDCFVLFSEHDALGRCGTALSVVGPESMPKGERSSIGMIRPAGWQIAKYDFIDNGGFLYNRCHLIAWMLCGVNDDVRNLITGTRYLNTEAMLPYERRIADVIRETSCHVIYRVTPVFAGDELLPRGVQMEAMSVEDQGAALSFNVFCFNVQPSVTIDYATGNNHLVEEEPVTITGPDTAPALFGSFHRRALLCCILLPFAAAYGLRKISMRTLTHLLFAAGFLLAVMELLKQWYSYTVINGGIYDPWIFPFQICSVPMYLCLFLPLWKGRMKDTVLLYLWDFCFFGALLALLYPEAILRAPLPLRIHGFLWHALLLFIAFLILFAAKCRDDARAFFRTALLFLFFCLLATGVNLLLEGQGLPGSYPDMFYLTPYHPATQPVAREAEVLLGRLPARMLYVLALLFLGVLDHLFFRTVRKH
ncbi:MAG: YwaF family protein [Lachnospiraceae bacterium]|nr:YwaF family protein [Lachnospiraceae bacterium]